VAAAVLLDKSLFLKRLIFLSDSHLKGKLGYWVNLTKLLQAMKEGITCLILMNPRNNVSCSERLYPEIGQVLIYLCRYRYK
jgi:hypothetical protein